MAQAAMHVPKTSRDALYVEIVESLETLPELLKLVFVRSHYQGQSPTRIAEQLAIPVSSVESMLEDANQIFYRNLHQFHFDAR